MSTASHQQRGAALIIVLLLAATLSFLVLALVAATSQSARRTGGAMLRGELLWRASSAEIIARAAIEEALRAANAGGPPLTRAHPLFSQQLIVPFPDGAGAIVFADANRCFNINSLGGGEAGGGGDDEGRNGAVAEFVTLLTTTGLSDADAHNLAAVVTDWIDEDNGQGIGGAEDDFYASLPTPYRTGGGPLASISELRAMKGVTGALYAGVSPYLCAFPSTSGAVLNINALRPEDGLLLTALTGGTLDPETAAGILENRPPGGWTTIEQFLALPPLQDEELDAQRLTSRISVSPQYVEAVAGTSVNDIDMSVRLLFSAENSGSVNLISRVLGTDA